jgi:hypothetical protein
VAKQVTQKHTSRKSGKTPTRHYGPHCLSCGGTDISYEYHAGDYLLQNHEIDEASALSMARRWIAEVINETYDDDGLRATMCETLMELSIMEAVRHGSPEAQRREEELEAEWDAKSRKLAARS